MKQLILISGMPGSGKTTVAKLIGEHGFTVVSMGDAVREEAESRGVGRDIVSMSRFMVKLRKELGDDAVARLVEKKIEKSDSKIIVVDGLRSLREAEYFKSKGYFITRIAVLAPASLRYNRLSNRGRSDDPETLRELEERDRVELSVGIGEVLALSDVYIVNDVSLKELEEAVESKLKEILSKNIDR
ncbi:MAG: nucleoside monophosphate kinase [Candidatus Brockarchaeota archaeon]|nr:nucleoside monophosphate kinase [Candidatus Brockarchaeota archaeon]